MTIIKVESTAKLIEYILQNTDITTKLMISNKVDDQCSLLSRIRNCEVIDQEADIIIQDKEQKIIVYTDEYQYLYLLQQLLQEQELREDRTQTGTLSQFGKSMSFDLSKGFPLLTTKKVYWKGIVEELLFFIRGQTDCKQLNDKGVKIWNGNTTRQFLDDMNLQHYQEFDMGPMYGFQWRNAGIQYKGCHHDYQDQGIDQLQQVIDLINNNPFSRRIILCNWDVSKLNEMVLNPCHVLAQFYVTNDNKLSCNLYQRSGDMFLGIPYNIASYSLLTMILCQICNKQPGTFNHFIGDAHIYSNHIEQCKTQIERSPFSLPKVYINQSLTNINDIVYEDIKLINYQSHPIIKATMAV